MFLGPMLPACESRRAIGPGDQSSPEDGMAARGRTIAGAMPGDASRLRAVVIGKLSRLENVA